MSAKKRGKAAAAGAGDDGIGEDRATYAALAKPPSAVKGRGQSKASRKALHLHDREKPTREHASRGEFTRMRGEKIDTRHKGEMLLVNLANRARGAGVMFNRGQISEREMRAAEKLCELAELAQLSQLSGMMMGERVDGGKVDTDGARLGAAAAAVGKYRDAVGQLSRCGRILVENCVVGGMAMEDAVRLRVVAIRLGEDNTLKNRVTKAMLLTRDALDKLADSFHLPGA